MANKKISELTEKTTTSETIEVPVNDAGTTKRITKSNLFKKGKVFTVGSSGCDYTTIQGAIDAAVTAGATETTRYVIEINAGTYTENVTSYVGIDLIGNNRVTIAGTLTAPSDCDIIGVEVTGLVTATGYEPNQGGGISRDPIRGWNLIDDRATERPRFSSASLIALVVDDANETWKTSFTALGSITPLAYVQSKRIPINFGPNPALVGTGSYPTALELGDNIMKCGGEILWHTYTHDATHPGMPVGSDSDYYETRDAVDWLEANISPTGKTGLKYPCLGGLWAGVTNYAVQSDVSRCDVSTKRGRLIRRLFKAYRDWSNTSLGLNDPRGKVTIEYTHSTMPPAGRIPTNASKPFTTMFYNLAAVDGNYATNRVIALTKFLNLLKYSKHTCITLWFHSIVADTTAADSGVHLNVTVFKTLIDWLATEMDSATPAVIPVPFTQMHWTYPCAAGEEPNLAFNPGFEYAYGTLPSSTTQINATANYVYPNPTFTLEGSSTAVIDAHEDDGGSLTGDWAAHGGNQAMVLYRQSTNPCHLAYDFLACVPGEQYLVSWWQLADETLDNGAIWPAVSFEGLTGTISFTTAASAHSAGWVKRWFFVTVPKGAQAMNIRFQMGVSDTKLYIDDVFIG